MCRTEELVWDLAEVLRCNILIIPRIILFSIIEKYDLADWKTEEHIVQKGSDKNIISFIF